MVVFQRVFVCGIIALFALSSLVLGRNNRAPSKFVRLCLRLCFLGVSGGFAARNTQKRIIGGGFAAPEAPPEVTLTTP
jgi:hypothetical protein